ncbi:MAG: TatD family hydrolase [Candidatus Velamenicoccus archaeovorus]
MDEQNPEPPVHTGAVDTHCHLFLLEDEPPQVVEAARATGVDTLVCVGIDPETSRRSVELAESLRGVFATAGMHPHTASDLDLEAGARIEELLANPQVVGVGECGLDFFRMRSPRQDQERVFRLHIALSRESGTPLVVHVRDAWPEALALLEEGGADRVILHCFSGDATVAAECVARGYYLSFAGNLTYPKNQHLRDAAAAAPLERILVETDSPFLAPQALRGRDNVPANVRHVIEQIASVRGIDPHQVRAATSANARTAFPGLR